MKKLFSIVFLVLCICLYLPLYSAAEDTHTFYDMGLTEFKAFNYSKAADLFEKAINEEPSNSLAHYYLGMSFYKQKNYKKALGYLIFASDHDPGIKNNGYYYSGICYRKLGEIAKAAEKFEYVSKHSDSNRLRAYSDYWLELINSLKSSKAYSIYLKIGHQYDNNVRLKADDDIGDPKEKDSDKDDYATNIFLSLDYNFINKNKIKSGLSYSHYQIIHNSLDEYDLTGSICNLYVDYTTGPVRLGFNYLPSYYWVDSERYLMRHQFEPEITWNITKNIFSRSSYSYYDNNYIQNDDRDGNINEISQEFWYKLDNKAGYAFAGLAYEHNSASHPDYDYSQWKSKAGVSLNMPWDLNFTLTGKYFNKKYDNEDSLFGVNREDVKYYTSVSLSRKIFYDWLWLCLEYDYTNNNSNINDYEYDKHVTALSLTIKF